MDDSYKIVQKNPVFRSIIRRNIDKSISAIATSSPSLPVKRKASTKCPMAIDSKNKEKPPNPPCLGERGGIFLP